MDDDRGAGRDGGAAGDRHRSDRLQRTSDLAGARRSRGCRCATARARRRRAGSDARFRPTRCDRATRRRRWRASSVSPSSRATVPGKIATTIFEALCEDQLIQPTFVYDFPTEVSPLSKQKPDDLDTVERFELYIGGFEVANAFSELNDPDEQRRRFEASAAGSGARRSRSARHGRGLHPGARVRPAADRRRRRRHRSPGDAADQQPVDPRRDPVPVDAAARRDGDRGAVARGRTAAAGTRTDPDGNSLRAPDRVALPARQAEAGLHLGHLGDLRSSA